MGVEDTEPAIESETPHVDAIEGSAQAMTEAAQEAKVMAEAAQEAAKRAAALEEEAADTTAKAAELREAATEITDRIKESKPAEGTEDTLVPFDKALLEARASDVQETAAVTARTEAKPWVAKIGENVGPTSVVSNTEPVYMAKARSFDALDSRTAADNVQEVVGDISDRVDASKPAEGTEDTLVPIDEAWDQAKAGDKYETDAATHRAAALDHAEKVGDNVDVRSVVGNTEHAVQGRFEATQAQDSADAAAKAEQEAADAYHDAEEKLAA